MRNGALHFWLGHVYKGWLESCCGWFGVEWGESVMIPGCRLWATQALLSLRGAAFLQEHYSSCSGPCAGGDDAFKQVFVHPDCWNDITNQNKELYCSLCWKGYLHLKDPVPLGDASSVGSSPRKNGADVLQRGVQLPVDAPQLSPFADLSPNIETVARVGLHYPN